MIERVLETSFGNLAYEKHGDGSEVYLLFHGFGQNRKAFKEFLRVKKNENTFYLIDIFYHGQSSWVSSKYTLSKAKWSDIMHQFLDQEKITSFHLVGYSMGGKFSLVTYELFPSRILSLLLIAPDGIKTGFWYSMTTFPSILNKVFKHVVFHPERFFKTMNILNKLGVLEKSIMKFVESQMNTRTRRAQVYFTWIVFKPIKPNLRTIIKVIRSKETPITLITGTYDIMVTAENLNRFRSKIPHIIQIELPCGHNSLIEETSKYILDKRNE
ncbi:alpha/beta fold hydrolase [Belliella pelovolcani]|uniref:Pimeloyl-ACP methyl ester carboxylesterase n=1 Tax=Belliella pelovolcani TaxID=529505 RepID=A0A1N7NE04_9BACT|nr:alpha/beta hydrolase [Belliella pelovolcani]SIS96419.1 Pimeloyl-ACP methyl ester carboxylesterase [Belliella pelovolcani]